MIDNNAIEFQALITERNGMIADNSYCKGVGESPAFRSGDFFAIAEKMRALKEKPFVYQSIGEALR